MTARRRHVHEIDLVRVLTFACVIAVHTISTTNSSHNVTAWSAEMLLHFTREAFFFITGFVLVHQNLGSRIRLKPFWTKRLITVGVPYLVWSLIYALIHVDGSPSRLAHFLPGALLYGTAWYHLYFLLVSMQIYLLFPLISELVRRTAGRHGRLLVASAVIELATLSWLRFWPPQHGWLLQVVRHDDAIVLSYQFYVLAGAVAAYHLEQTLALVRTHRRAVAAWLLIAAAAAEGWYALGLHDGHVASNAATVLQPVMLLWSCAAIAGLFVLGGWWADHRRAGSRADRALAIGSDRSFGVFLVHPGVLWLLMEGQSRWVKGLHGLGLTVVAYALVVAGSMALTELFRRSPLSLALTGRNRMRPRPETAPTHDRKDVPDVLHQSDPAGTPVQATQQGRDDDDRRRPADALLR